MLRYLNILSSLLCILKYIIENRSSILLEARKLQHILKNASWLLEFFVADDLDFLPTASSIFTAAAGDKLQLGCSLSKWGQAAE